MAGPRPRLTSGLVLLAALLGPGLLGTGLLGTGLLGTVLPGPVGTSAAAAASAPPGAAAAVAVFTGRGHGHGVGMAQDGARTLGVRGAGLREVLGTFYPGTRLGRAGGTLRVSVWDGGAAVVVRLPTGGTVSAPGAAPLEAAPDEAVRLTVEGDALVATASRPGSAPAPAADTRGAAPAPPGALRSRGPLTVTPRSAGTTTVDATARAYRGTVRALHAGSGLRLVNTVDVEDYLLGLGEVRDPSWPRASLEAQAVASRSYALASRGAGAGFDLWDDTRSQVYLGTGGEYAAQSRAVRATAGLVLTFAGAVVPAYFSTNGGGVTATGAEGFGGTDSPPWLRAAGYPTDDVDPWRFAVTLRRAGALLDYPGTMTTLSVGRRGPSGRAVSLVLDGSAGPRDVPAVRAQRALGLRSTLFSVAVPRPVDGLRAAPPPPPTALLPVPPRRPAQVPRPSPTRSPGSPLSTTAPSAVAAPRPPDRIDPTGATVLPASALATATALLVATVAGLVVALTTRRHHMPASHVLWWSGRSAARRGALSGVEDDPDEQSRGR